MQPPGDKTGATKMGTCADDRHPPAQPAQASQAFKVAILVLTASYCSEVTQFEYQTDSNMDTAESECAGWKRRGKHCVRVYLVSMPSPAGANRTDEIETYSKT